MALTIKRGDLEPALVSTLSLGEDANGDPVDLTTADGVSCRIRDKLQNRAPFGGTATIADAAANVVMYEFQVGDNDVADDYALEWVVDWGEGRLQTVPGSGFSEYTVEESLDDADEAAP